MPSPGSGPPSDLTGLLKRARGGDREAEADLFQAVYGELRRLARMALRNERHDHTLQPTALLHEAYIRLLGAGAVEWVDRQHFFATAARTMRRVLIDYARSQRAKKNDGTRVDVDLDAMSIFTEAKSEALVALDLALEDLDQSRPRLCRVVELLYFAGLTIEEAADVLGVSSRTVKRDWKVARVWLHGAIQK